MKKLIYVTGNRHKIIYTQRFFDRYNIKIVQKKIKIDEIQSDSVEEIVEDKAKKAYKMLHKPLIVSDSEWKIPTLKGFPGPYMKYVNEWFSADDFLNLMKGKKNKIIYLNHLVCAIDKRGVKTFKKRIRGNFVKKPQGKGTPLDRVVVLGNNKYTIAKCDNLKIPSAERIDDWPQLIKWIR
ncbi:MAG: non-canonical purine NTP pyrophosphatase [Candidatus Pacebacteria bacterium]|nr:non-canonical purine NTP pyrophosphatase [Candidatus Paceibacterota bacterium]